MSAGTMSQRNVQIVSAFFDAAVDVGEAAEAFLAEDAEFVPFTRLAGSGSRGPEGFTRQITEIADQFAEYEVRPEQLRPAGDHVVAGASTPGQERPQPGAARRSLRPGVHLA